MTVASAVHEGEELGACGLQLGGQLRLTCAKDALSITQLGVTGCEDGKVKGKA